MKKSKFYVYKKIKFIYNIYMNDFAFLYNIKRKNIKINYEIRRKNN